MVNLILKTKVDGYKFSFETKAINKLPFVSIIGEIEKKN